MHESAFKNNKDKILIIIMIILEYATFIQLDRNLQSICIFIIICKNMQKYAQRKNVNYKVNTL